MEVPHFHFNNLFRSGNLMKIKSTIFCLFLRFNKGVLDLDKILSSLFLRSSFSFQMYKIVQLMTVFTFLFLLSSPSPKSPITKSLKEGIALHWDFCSTSRALKILPGYNEQIASNITHMIQNIYIQQGCNGW